MNTAGIATSDQIEKSVTLRAPRSRVWRAVTDSQEFGAWFGVKLQGTFTPGGHIRGSITHKDFAHVSLEIVVDRIEPETLFSFRWHPYAIDPNTDYTREP